MPSDRMEAEHQGWCSAGWRKKLDCWKAGSSCGLQLSWSNCLVVETTECVSEPAPRINKTSDEPEAMPMRRIELGAIEGPPEHATG